MLGKNNGRRLPVMRAACCLLGALSACSSEPEKESSKLPSLRPGFVLLAERTQFIENAALSGFNVDVSGLATSPDGNDIAAVVRTSTWRTTFTESSTYDPDTDTFDPNPGGTVTTRTNEFELHVSHDGGATYKSMPISPGLTGIPGAFDGLMFLESRLYSTVTHRHGRGLAELDMETGRYEMVGLSDGRQTSSGLLARHVYEFGGRIVGVWQPQDGHSFHAIVADVGRNKIIRHAIANPECIPMMDLSGRGSTHGVVATWGSLIQGLCTLPDNRLCAFRWELDDGNAEGTSMSIEGCTSKDAYRNLSLIERDGVVPTFDPVFVLPSPKGLFVVGEAMYAGRDYARRQHAVAVRFGADAVAEVIDFGRGAVQTPNDMLLHHQFARRIRITSRCEESTGTGRCLGELASGDEGADRFAGWNPERETLTLVPLSPSACEVPASCPAQATSLTSLARDNDRYPSVWNFSTDLSGDVTRGVALGYVTAPWYTPPVAPAGPTSVSELELRCWAQLACQPEAFQQGPEDVHRRVEECVSRWGTLRGAPDLQWQAFAGADLDDCPALRAADPMGFATGCAYDTCDASGRVACGIASCELANGGLCSVIEGKAGCYAQSCSAEQVTSGEAFCDEQGRLVDCWRGLVDDCAARGAVCGAKWGCLLPETRCEQTLNAFCDGSMVVQCLSGNEQFLSQRRDCARVGQTCVEGEGYAACSQPPVTEVSDGCEGNKLIRSGRVVDCGAVGLVCDANPTLPSNSWCVPPWE